MVYEAEVVRYPGREARDNARYLITNLDADPEVIDRRVYAAQPKQSKRRGELLHFTIGGTSIDRGGVCQGASSESCGLGFASSE